MCLANMASYGIPASQEVRAGISAGELSSHRTAPAVPQTPAAHTETCVRCQTTETPEKYFEGCSLGQLYIKALQILPQGIGSSLVGNDISNSEK